MARGLQPGASVQLGKLIVGKKLGEGGFGVVHKARLEGINIDFAVKFLDPSSFNRDVEGARKRFFREAELLFKFRHPYIVPIYGVGEHEQKPYILMEYFKGVSLTQAKARAKGLFDPQALLPFVRYVAEALAYAHKRNVVHRDIKPSNLMTIRGDARVLDFGLAGLVDPESERFTRSSDAVGGGDPYMAPELSDNPKLVDPRTDIYSIGACWFWLLTGQAPKGRNWEAALRASVTVSPHYERVLLRCLNQLDSRYPSADELIRGCPTEFLVNSIGLW